MEVTDRDGTSLYLKKEDITIVHSKCRRLKNHQNDSGTKSIIGVRAGIEAATSLQSGGW